jgi:hypothetical protein
MKKTLRRLAIVAAAVTLTLISTGCGNRRSGHNHHVADHGYYHYPHRPAYHSNHHHTHYSGCGHKTVSYHYY